MTRYPILFSRRDRVDASHYTAGVIVAGRVLVTEELDGEFWAEGVIPGGLAAKGDTAIAALHSFCETYHRVLLDIADDEPSFESFNKAVERFFADTNLTALKEWDDAVLEVRAGNLTMDNMAKRPSESPIGIKVLLLEKKTSNEEEVSDAAMAA